MGNKIDIDLLDDGSGGSYYTKERKVYPRDISGRLDRLRKLAVAWLLGMYYVFPWLRWDGRQAVLFDLPARKFHVFGLTFWPQDFSFLAMLLIILALLLFFVTALAGRLWCGYACPQTVWTEVFLWMERWTEGDRNKRMKLDAGPWTREKILRKGSKHALWLLFALWTGFTFVGFFTPIVDLGARLWPFAWNGWESFWVFFYALATWGNAGFLREQVCKYMCPYARFQSAMFDRNTLIIAYDPMRGEPRGPRKRGLGDIVARGRALLDKFTAYDYVFRASSHPSAADARTQARGTITFDGAAAEPLPKFPAEELGDCIDCTMCVQVCPTGIDIRDGLQIECIGCAACIDACDSIMDKMNYPRGLISYTTEHNLSGQKTHKLRPRLIGYALVLLTMMGLLAAAFFTRTLVGFDVSKDRVLYRENAEGRIENVYSLKIMNKDQHDHTYVLEATGLPDLKLQGKREIKVAAGDIVSLPVELSIAPEKLPSSTNEVFFILKDADNNDVNVKAKSRFIGPQIR